jgi:hypothetical protein
MNTTAGGVMAMDIWLPKITQPREKRAGGPDEDSKRR